MLEMQHANSKVFLWLDEKFITVEAVVNYQDNKLYATSPANIPKDVRMHFKWQEATGVMVWAGAVSDGSKSPLVFIEGVKVNRV